MTQKMLPFQVILYHFIAEGIDFSSHVKPSGETATFFVKPIEGAQNTLPFHATDAHESTAGRVDATQSMPFEEIAAAVVEPCAVAQKTLPLLQRQFQLLALGRVRAVHVIPSGDVAAILEFCAIAQKSPLLGFERAFRECGASHPKAGDCASNTVPPATPIFPMNSRLLMPNSPAKPKTHTTQLRLTA